MRYLDVILTLLSCDASLELVTSQLRPYNVTTLFGRNIDVIVALGVPWVGSDNRLDWTVDQIILELIRLWEYRYYCVTCSLACLNGVRDQTGGGLMFEPRVLQ